MSGPFPSDQENATSHELTPSMERHLQLVVCGHSHDVDDARRLLQMLDLIEQPVLDGPIACPELVEVETSALSTHPALLPCSPDHPCEKHAREDLDD